MAKKKEPAFDPSVAEQLWKQSVEKAQAEIRRRELTQMQIAADTGISQPAISRLMANGEIKFDRLMILLDYLDFEWVVRTKRGGTRTEKVTTGKRKTKSQPQSKAPKIAKTRK